MAHIIIGQKTYAQVRITLAPIGEQCQVEILDKTTNTWIDISKEFVGLDIRTRVGDLTSVVIEVSPLVQANIKGAVHQVLFSRRDPDDSSQTPSS